MNRRIREREEERRKDRRGMKQREIPTVRDGDVSKMDGNGVSLTVEGIRYRGKRGIEEEEEEK